MQNNADPALLAFLAGYFVFIIICSVIALAIQIFIVWLLFDGLKRVPPEYRKQEPAYVWLLFVPLLNMVWPYFVYPKISASYRAYFEANNIQPPDDCGHMIGMAYCVTQTLGMVLGCFSVVPLLGIVFTCAILGLVPLQLILLIIFLVKLQYMKNMIPLDAAGAYVVGASSSVTASVSEKSSWPPAPQDMPTQIPPPLPQQPPPLPSHLPPPGPPGPPPLPPNAG